MGCFLEDTCQGSSTAQASTLSRATRDHTPRVARLVDRIPGERPADAGTRIHSAIDQANRDGWNSNGLHASGDWRPLLTESGEPAYNRSLGTARRPDEVVVSHMVRTVVCIDLFTGSGPEPMAHARKGWSYAAEPQIKALIDKGYSYVYSCLSTSTIH